jgi:hypothetical protein
MVRSRVHGILAGSADQNDHDTLRADPVFKLLADRSANESELASKPTLSRFDTALTVKPLKGGCATSSSTSASPASAARRDT